VDHKLRFLRLFGCLVTAFGKNGLGEPYRQYSRKDMKMGIREWFFKDITVRKALTEEDYRNVFECRLRGYGKYYGFNNLQEVIDDYDYSPHCCLLLAEERGKRPVGTIRIIDRRGGPIELDQFIDVEHVIKQNEHPCVEATRFSVPGKQSKFRRLLIKLLLNRAYYDYCKLNNIETMIMSLVSENKKFIDYFEKKLCFADVGVEGRYCHSILDEKEHRTFKHKVSEGEKNMAKSWNPICRLLVRTNGNINTSGFLYETSESYKTEHP
jgi:hypothetical protein